MRNNSGRNFQDRTSYRVCGLFLFDVWNSHIREIDMKNVITVKIIVNNEPVPGWGHDPKDMAKAAARAAAETLGSYDPIVIAQEVELFDDHWQLTDGEAANLLRHMTKEDAADYEH